MDKPDRSHTWLFLAAYYALAVVWGVRNVYLRLPSALDYLVPALVAVALCWWAIVDARRRGRPLPLLSRSWVLLFADGLVPAYVVGSRRWRGVGWVILHGVCWLVLSAVVTGATHVAGQIAFGPRWWQVLGR